MPLHAISILGTADAACILVPFFAAEVCTSWYIPFFVESSTPPPHILFCYKHQLYPHSTLLACMTVLPCTSPIYPTPCTCVICCVICPLQLVPLAVPGHSVRASWTCPYPATWSVVSRPPSLPPRGATSAPPLTPWSHVDWRTHLSRTQLSRSPICWYVGVVAKVGWGG